MIALFGAVRMELSSITKEMKVIRGTYYRGWRLLEGKFGCKNVLLMQTGMGKDRAKESAEYVLEQYHPTIVISLGFCGALVAGLEVGDLVVYRGLSNDNHPDSNRIHLSHPDLIATANGIMDEKLIHLLIVDSLSVNRLVSDPEEKERLGLIHRAQVVDMESYWIANIAARRKIPFLAVRVISDSMSERLPPFDHFLGRGGEMLWGKALQHFVLKPVDLMGLVQMYGQARLARESLTEFIRILVPELPQEISDESNIR